jgi:signal transduction histidine kinase
MSLSQQLSMVAPVEQPDTNSDKRSHFGDFLLNFSVAQRLTLGFLSAALIAALTISMTGLYNAQSFNKQSSIYQDLVQTNRDLLTGSNILVLMNIKVHEPLNTIQSGVVSIETLEENRRAVKDLADRYETILARYRKNHLLYLQPDQVSMLATANQLVLVDRQVGLVGGAVRTWNLYKHVQEGVLNLLPGLDLAKVQRVVRVYAEPTFADALSAIRGLMQFNELLTSTVRNAMHIQSNNLLLLNIISGLLACFGIILAGTLITNTFMRRLNQLRSVARSVERGERNTRVAVVGRDEIAEVSFSVNAMVEAMVADAIAYEQQKQLNAFKDEFILNVSHELRTPLTQVYGFIELLIDYHRELDERQQLTFLQRAKYGCQELMHLVNSVLDATRASSGIKPPPLKDIALAVVVRDVIEHLDPRYEQDYTIKLSIPETLIVKADYQYLRQIVRNLFSNAFKYSPKHTIISIDAEVIEEASEKGEVQSRVRVCVSDTGPGIPPEEIAHLFQRFVRLKRDVAGTVRGTGLGLYVCKQLVEAMQGRIWVESTGIAGEGSHFYFLLLPGSPASEER